MTWLLYLMRGIIQAKGDDIYEYEGGLWDLVIYLSMQKSYQVILQKLNP